MAQGQEHVAQPVLARPWLSEGGETPGVRAGDAAICQHLLPGADVPPHIWIDQRPGRSGKQRHSEEGDDRQPGRRQGAQPAHQAGRDRGG